jgi:hypothetical protein
MAYLMKGSKLRPLLWDKLPEAFRVLNDLY